MALRGKKKLFADEYLIDRNATQAAIRAGYSEKTARSQGQRLLKEPKVKAYIDAFIGDQSERLNMTAERVMEEIARIALFDPRKMFRDDGSLKRITEIDDATAAAIAGMDIDEIKIGDKTTTVTRKIKIASKASALEMAVKYFGLNQTKQSAALDRKLKQLAIKQRELEIELLRKQAQQEDAGDKDGDWLAALVEHLPD